MPALRIEVVTAERTVLEEEADMILAPGSEGQLGILPRHTPLLTALEPGEVRLKKNDGGVVSLAITGGFLEIIDNTVTVLANAAEHIHEIDLARAKKAMERAQNRIQTQDADLELERARQSYKRASARIHLAKKRP